MLLRYVADGVHVGKYATVDVSVVFGDVDNTVRRERGERGKIKDRERKPQL